MHLTIFVILHTANSDTITIPAVCKCNVFNHCIVCPLLQRVHLAPLVLEAHQDPQELMAHKDPLVVLETLVLSEKR